MVFVYLCLGGVVIKWSSIRFDSRAVFSSGRVMIDRFV